tara:strand:+ start:2868 stop:4721 length:1854 start_codon:yes stop_codon:yes gene_type:complete
MAIEKVIKIDVDSSSAVKGLKDITDSVENVGDAAEDASQQVSGVGQSAKNSKAGFQIMSKGIGAVGLALKTAGIGLIISAIAGLSEAFSRNKKVMDKVEIVLGTIGQVFQQVITAITDTYEAITSTSENFDALGRVIRGLIKLSINPFLIVINNLMLGLNSAALAYQVMFGDSTGILKAQKAIDETKKRITDLALETIEAGKDVVNGFSEAINEVSNIGEIVGENLSKISLTAANNQAKANKLAIDGAKLAEAQAGRLIAKYERESELQRQIRDDVSKSVSVRQEANEKLADILDEQEKALLSQADAIIAGARAELQKNGGIEQQAALISALAGKEQVLNDITGKRSEQLTNQTALLIEQKDLLTTVTDAELERQRIQKEFEAEQETDPLKKLQLQKEAFELENQAILDDLERKKELYAEGTQARVDAEQDFLNKKQALDNKISANATKTAEITSKKDIKFADLTASAKLDIAGQSLGAIAGLVDRQSIAGKGIAIAQVGVSTASGIIKALAENPPPNPLGAIGAAIVGVAGLAQTMSIAKEKIPSATGKGFVSGGATGGGSVPTAPSFNLIEGTADNQINESINLGNQEPIQAFVVSGDVTTAQNLDNNIITESGL